MTIHHFIAGALQVNCYILISNKNNAVIIDPGAQGEDIVNFCKKQGVTVKKILLTHGHFDHIGGVAEIVKETGAKVYIHKEDGELLNNSALNGATDFNFDFNNTAIDEVSFVCDTEQIKLDDINLTVMHTPGHSKGSVIFIGDDVIFTGDTLFESGIGRTDLYGGSFEEIRTSINKIKNIDGEYMVLPGHGGSSTLQKEKITNPYMGNNYDDIF